MLAALALVAACTAWHADVVGFYPGTVESEGAKSIDTWISLSADGKLEGRYVLHETTRDVTGTLDAVGDDGCDTAVFEWNDLYGTGLARLRFDPATHCFDGAWGGFAINPALVWHACAPNRVTS